MDNIAWNIIHKYFRDNPFNLVNHHLDSYNDFYSKGIFQIIRENNPIRFIETKNPEAPNDPRAELFVYIGGKNGERLYFGKPIIYDETYEDGQPKSYPHYMYPNDARLRSMTYGSTIHYDVDVEFNSYVNGEKVVSNMSLEKMYMGTFPIMVNSNQCILNGLSRDVKYNMGECLNDHGGYFIIKGKEKCILSQEKFGDNMLYVKKHKDDIYSYSCEVRSVSEDSSKPLRYTSVRILEPTPKGPSGATLVVDVPNVSKPVPLFILMRALGVISDKSVIEYCLLNLQENSNMVDLFIPSVHEACGIFTQELALNYIKTFTKRHTTTYVLNLLTNYFLPHIGEENFLDKAYYIGFMVKKLLNVYIGREKPTDRDNFKFKRVDTTGALIYELFREYYLLQLHETWLILDKKFYYRPAFYRADLSKLIESNYKEIFSVRKVEEGFNKGFRGNWGSIPKTKKVGLVQDLNRLSWFTFISHLRKVILPLDPTSKVVGPHLLHGSSWGLMDPLDTPDGGNVGLHKHLSISTLVTNKYPSINIIKWIRANMPLKLLQECTPEILSLATKVFVNGIWIGVIDDPIDNVAKLKLFRRNGIIPIYTSITFSYESNVIYIYTDAGRLIRPVYYKDQESRMSYARFKDKITSGDFTWVELVSGFLKKMVPLFNIRNNVIYDTTALYPYLGSLKEMIEEFHKNGAVVDYLDTSESENALIAFNLDQVKTNKYYTHLEIDPSLLLGVMGNSIIFPEFNQLPRDVFSCGQSRQAVSMYNSNYHMRLDKMGVVLNYGQTPLVKSRYLEYINHEEQPYGVNTIVAIMSYTGYNVEDAILINKSSIDRGLFNTTYFTTYEAHEESSKVDNGSTNSIFTNIETKHSLIKNLKDEYDYSHLDEYGLVKVNTVINDRIVLIGQLASGSTSGGNMNEGKVPIYADHSKTTKKGQLGVVDKSFMSEGEEGYRIAKVRVCENRQPAIGDKMACALPTQQVLTNEGWVEIKDIDINRHKVATLDINGNMCYEYPVNKFEYYHYGKMCSVRTDTVEFVCTLNHKLYVKDVEESPLFEFMETEQAMNKTLQFKTNMNNAQDDLACVNINDGLITSDHYLSIITEEHKSGILDQFKHMNHLFLIKGDQLLESIWNFSKQQCLQLIPIFQKIRTSSKLLANDIARFYVHCGYSGIIELQYKMKYVYSVKLIEDNEPIIDLKTTSNLIDYEGQVYCIEMPSSHLYYMREHDYAPSMLIGNSRAGQKGTIGLIIPEEDMPFTADGIKPDLIINPHALPSRMTIGQLIECLFGKACVLYGSYGNSTAFMTKGPNMKTYGEMLNNMGYHKSGNELMYNGFTGEQIKSEIFIGPTYYMRLKHMVKDKINYRATGKRSNLTRQTNQGRANDGGLRVGEMERDGIMGHGMSSFLNDSFMIRGDEYYMAVCNKTGSIAVYNPSKNIFLSPYADGPLVFNKDNQGEPVLDSISRYGRSFSIVRVPYSLKLLMQELEVLGVQMKIITEDNIDQLMNLSFQSSNMNKLLHMDDDIDVTKIVTEYAKILSEKYSTIKGEVAPMQPKYDLRKEMRDLDREMGLPVTPEGLPPPINRGTPEGPPPRINRGTPEGPPPSAQQRFAPPPGWQPGQTYSPPLPPPPQPNSPPYAPDSPPYAPDSPPYAPDSPPYAPDNQSGGGSFFQDPVMMSYFNRLPIQKQSVLRSLGPTKAHQIMTQIIHKLDPQNQNTYTTITNPSKLLENRIYTGAKEIFKVEEPNKKEDDNKKDNHVQFNDNNDGKQDNSSSDSSSKSIKIVKV